MFQDPEDNIALQIAPTIHHQARAIFALIQRYNWTQFGVITTDVGGSQQFVTSLATMAFYSQKQARVTVKTSGSKR